jgi:hypothetical protein
VSRKHGIFSLYWSLYGHTVGRPSISPPARNAVLACLSMVLSLVE